MIGEIIGMVLLGFLLIGMPLSIIFNGKKRVGMGIGLIFIPLYVFLLVGIFVQPLNFLMMAKIFSVPMIIGAIVARAWFLIPLILGLVVMTFTSGKLWYFIFPIAGILTVLIAAGPSILIALVGTLAGNSVGRGNGGDKTIEHYDSWGKRTGESKVKGSKIEHYNDWGKKTGESKAQGNKIEHYNDWGESTGESRIRGKTIELYDSRGNLIGESQMRGNVIEHRDGQGEDKGSSKIK